eukprot:COSAG01_NODE_7613_length_3127_cov_1.861625_3_plen_113_part_00
MHLQGARVPTWRFWTITVKRLMDPLGCTRCAALQVVQMAYYSHDGVITQADSQSYDDMFRSRYTNVKNIQMWCGEIAVDGNSYSNPGYCSSQHCQPQGDGRICYRFGLSDQC